MLTRIRNAQRRLYNARRALLQLCVFSLLCAVTLYTYMSIDDLPSSITNTGNAMIIVLVSLSTLSVLYKGSYLSILTIFGSLIVIGTLLFPTQDHISSTYEQFDTDNNENKVKHLVWKYNPAYALTSSSKLLSFYLGIGLIGLSNIILYKPNLLYAKNRPNDDPPYTIWDSKHSYTTYKYRDMIPLVDLLKEDEKFMLTRYRYIVVRIGERVYLVTINSKVPDSSEIIRKNDQFIGVQ